MFSSILCSENAFEQTSIVNVNNNFTNKFPLTALPYCTEPNSYACCNVFESDLFPYLYFGIVALECARNRMCFYVSPSCTVNNKTE